MAETAAQPEAATPSVEPPHPGAACVICLDVKLKDPTILDCCQHFFCHECINQWLLTNPSCPMCKKHLHKIKHNLSPVPDAFPVPYDSVKGTESTVEDLLTDYEMGFLREQPNSLLKLEKQCVDERIEKLYHKTLRLRRIAEEGDITSSELEKKVSEVHDQIKRLTHLKDLISNRNKRSVVFNTPEFRRLIYSANFTPRARLSPRFPADLSSGSICANETLFRRRLIPFLIRELTAILDRPAVDITFYLDLVMNYLKTLDRATKNGIIGKLQRTGVPHPLHFISNIQHFLSSGQRLEVYDENCDYKVRGTSDIRSYFAGSSDNDVEFLSETVRLTPPPRMFPPRSSLDQWAQNMRMDYFRPSANNPPAPVTNNVITLEANDDQDTIVLDDDRPIILDDDDDREGSDERSIFAHPDCLLPPSRQLRRPHHHIFPNERLSPSIYQTPGSSALGLSRYLSSNIPRYFEPRYMQRSQSPPAIRRSQSPPISSDFSRLHERLQIFDGLGPMLRRSQENVRRRRSRSPPHLRRERSFTPEGPSRNDGPSNVSVINLNESDSDVEVVGQTSNTPKRPRYDDVH